MLTTDLVQETFFSLLGNKARSALTILGIVIGISSVIAMVSIGQGASFDIEQRIQSLGSNLLVITPGSSQSLGSVVRGGSGSASTLIIGDAEAIIQEINSIVAVAPVVSAKEQVKIINGNNTNSSIYGVTDSYATVKNVAMSSGSFITSGHNQRISKVAVIGSNVALELFGVGRDPLNQKLKIKNLEFTIIGVTASQGGTGFGSADDLIYIPIKTSQIYFKGDDSVNNINVQVSSEDQMEVVQSQISSLLLTRHKISNSIDADFTIINQADIMSAMTGVTATMTLLLGAIAGISLLVGGIGIMNMMLTTVTERTREIGLRKSLGASKSDVSTQFLAEAVSLTMLGGVLGVALGWVASSLVTKFSSLTTVVSLSSVILAFGVSVIIGLVFGYYPALRAAKLDPIVALRHE